MFTLKKRKILINNLTLQLNELEKEDKLNLKLVVERRK